MMMAREGSLSGERVDAFAWLTATAEGPHFDAYDCPAILIGDDSSMALETRAVLQSLGFDVFAGANLVDLDEVPVVIVLGDFLAVPDNCRKLANISAIWPSAPVVSISDPSDATAQLRSLFS